jgi:N-acetylglucosamine-6-sulfatase
VAFRALACALLLCVVLICAAPVEAALVPAKPNLIFILSDDQRVGTLSVMPATRADFNIGLNGFVTTPLCAPARSSFLTGAYAHNTGLLTNADYPAMRAREAQSIGPWLQAQGYYTGFIGKYINKYTVNDSTPPGWDEFRALVWSADGKPIGNVFTSWEMREHFFDGATTHDELVSYPNAQYPNAYSTRVIAGYGARFIAHAANPVYNPSGKPWALFVWTSAPNGAHPESRYANAWVPRWHPPPSFMEADMSDKPIEVRSAPDIINNVAVMRRFRAGQYRDLYSVDDLVDRVFNAVDDNGFTPDTYGIYASDNGRFWGEHHLKLKRFAYEEAIRVPLRIHIPGHAPEHLAQLAANIDIAPTLLDWAGDSSTHNADGTSLVPLINGTATAWRTNLLLENWERYHWHALRTNRYTYIRWNVSGHQELYDLRHGRYQLQNIAHEKPSLDAKLRARMITLANS